MARWHSVCGSARMASGRRCSCTSGATASASTSTGAAEAGTSEPPVSSGGSCGLHRLQRSPRGTRPSRRGADVPRSRRGPPAGRPRPRDQAPTQPFHSMLPRPLAMMSAFPILPKRFSSSAIEKTCRPTSPKAAPSRPRTTKNAKPPTGPAAKSGSQRTSTPCPHPHSRRRPQRNQHAHIVPSASDDCQQ